MNQRPEHQAANPAAITHGAPGRGLNRPLPVASRPIPLPAASRTASADGGDADRHWSDFFNQAPAWLVSASFHTSVLILLAIWAAVAVHQGGEMVPISAEPMREGDTLGEQPGEGPLAKPGFENGIVNEALVDLTPEESFITAPNAPPVIDPFATANGGIEIALDGHWAASREQSPVRGSAFSGREPGARNALLPIGGGDKGTEHSVGLGLEWLKKQQRPDGLWSLVGPYPDGAPEENVAAASAMALMAFQGQGHTHRRGQYTQVVKKGWDALLKLQSKDGDFVRNSSVHQKLYAQAQCTIAVCELYGMTGDSLYRTPAELAIQYALKAQDPVGGGWRYTPGQDSDTSVTGWFVMALQTAKMARLDVPQEALDKVSRHLDSVATPDGKYAYTQGTFTTPAVTAEGYLCREYLGWKQSDGRLIDGVGALNLNRVNYNAPDRDVYYWYYATQACHHMEGDIWKQWNTAMKQQVPSHQVKAGAQSGSWDPQGDKWGATGGRLYVTCLSVYMLEVYYRHLPPGKAEFRDQKNHSRPDRRFAFGGPLDTIR